MDPSLPTAARARDRRRPDRRRRRRPRAGAAEPGARRPRRALRRPGLLGRARALPDLGDRPAAGAARRLRLARRGRRARARRGRARPLPAAGSSATAGASGDWVTAIEPTQRTDLDPFSADVPVALWAKDDHSLWLNSAGLARADGDLAVAGGVVELDDAGEPTGDPARGGGVALPRPAHHDRGAGVRRGGAGGDPDRARARRDRGTRQGRLARSARRSGSASTRRARSACGSGSRFRTSSSTSSRRSGCASGLGDDFLRLGYLKAFMDGTLGSRTAWMLDGSGVMITSGEELAEIVRRAARAGWPVAVHAIGDRANREALDAFAGDARGVAAPRAAPARSSTRSSSIRRTSRASRRSASPAPCSSATRPPTAIWPIATGRASRRRVRVPLPLGLRRRDRERLGRADRGARSARSASGPAVGGRSTSGPPGRPEEALTVEEALLASDRERRLARRRRAPPRAARSRLPRRPRRPRPRPPRLPTRPSSATLAVVATMVGGRWVHNPPPWD